MSPGADFDTRRADIPRERHRNPISGFSAEERVALALASEARRQGYRRREQACLAGKVSG